MNKMPDRSRIRYFPYFINTLPSQKRVQIINILIEVNSLRTICLND